MVEALRKLVRKVLKLVEETGHSGDVVVVLSWWYETRGLGRCAMVV